MDILRQSANWGINVGFIGISWHYRDLNGTSRSSVTLVSKTLTLTGMHIASFHSFLVKKVRRLNSHQEVSHKKDHHHAQGRKAKLSGREGSVPQCDGVTNCPRNELALPPTTHLYPLWKIQGGRVEKQEPQCAGKFRISSSKHRGRQNSKIHWNERFQAACRHRISL